MENSQMQLLEVHYINLVGVLVAEKKVLKVDIFVVVIEFLSVPRQQADAGEIVQGERQRRQQVDQKIVIRHHSLAKRIPKGKRLHSLKDNICKGTQNGGKW